MSDSPVSIDDDLRTHLLLWMVVHHLLSAPLVRELAAAMVDTASAGSLRLEDIVEEVAPVGSPDTSSWHIRTRSTESTLADHLARLILHMIWQGDDVPFPAQDGMDRDGARWFADLRAAFILSSADINTSFHTIGEEDDSSPLARLELIIGHLREAVHGGGPFDAATILSSVGNECPAILHALLAKHLGDLCGDADRWDLAHDLYEHAQTALRQETRPEWRETAQATFWITKQCIAMSVWHLEGPGRAADLLETMVFERELGSDPLPVLNASFDLLNARVSSEVLFPGLNDRRAASLMSPQLLHSHDLQNALTYSEGARFRDAHRWFWATLRRQVALGGATSSRQTKAHYGRSIIDEVEAALDRSRQPEDFVLAARLLVEGGQVGQIEAARWTERLLEAYLDDRILDGLEASVKRAPGMEVERTMALLTLYREWLQSLSSESTVLAERMLRYLAQLAAERTHAGRTSVDVGGQALKAVRRIGTVRPEFRRLIGADLLRTVEAVIGRWGMLPVAEAIETAAVYVDGVDPQIASLLTYRTIAIVEGLPEDAAWPVTQAASRVVGSGFADRLAASDATFAKRRASALVRLALSSRMDRAALMYLLRDVDPSVVDEQVDAEGIRDLVRDLGVSAGEVTSSGATAAIHALLVAPKVSGRQGIEAALDGLDKIIRSAARPRPAPGFQNAYDPILLLAATWRQIADDLGSSQEDFREELGQLVEPLRVLWEQAAGRPLIFAGFAIPPRTAPDAVRVHNWTYATLEFLGSLGSPNALRAALRDAERNQALTDPMSVARAKHAAEGGGFDPSVLGSERPSAFYAALGQRLVSVLVRDDARASDQVEVLLNRCMEVGPRGEDAALLLEARRRSIRLDPNSGSVADYLARVRQDPRLRLSLTPLLHDTMAEPMN